MIPTVFRCKSAFSASFSCEIPARPRNWRNRWAKSRPGFFVLNRRNDEFLTSARLHTTVWHRILCYTPGRGIILHCVLGPRR